MEKEEIYNELQELSDLLWNLIYKNPQPLSEVQKMEVQEIYDKIENLKERI